MGIEAVEAIQNRQPLKAYYLLYAVLAEFETQLNQFPAAAAHLQKALELTEIKSEQQFLKVKLRECEERSVEAVSV